MRGPTATLTVQRDTGERISMKIFKNIGRKVAEGTRNIFKPKPPQVNRPRPSNPLDKIGDAIGDAAENVRDGIGDTARKIGDTVAPVAQTVGDVGKTVGEGIGAGVDKAADVVRPGAQKVGGAIGDGIDAVADKVDDVAAPVIDKVVDVAKPVGEKVGDVVKPAAKKVGDTLKPVVDKVTDIAEPIVDKVSDIAEPVVSEVGEKLKPVGEAIGDAVDHTFHFLQTGDFGKQVQKLMEEEAEARDALAESRIEYLESGRKMVSLHSQLRGLSIVYEQEGPLELDAPEAVKVDIVDINPHDSDTTRLLEDFGITAAANAMKFIHEVVMMPPHDLLLKQDDLAEDRRQLRENIDKLNAAKAETDAGIKRFKDTARHLTSEIARIEAKVAELGLDDADSKASAVRVAEVAADTRLDVARGLLENGLDVETVATISELGPDQVADLKASLGS